MSVKSSNDVSGAKKGSSVRYIIIIMILFIVMLALTFGIVLITKNGDSQQTTTTTRRSVIVNEQNVDEVVDKIVEKDSFVPPGSYEAVMNSTWNFKDGKSTSYNAYVENVAGNTNDVYFDVILNETQEVIYESPILPRGTYLDSIKLDKDLDAGTYDCVLIYHLVDGEQNTVSTLRMAIKIIIEG